MTINLPNILFFLIVFSILFTLVMIIVLFCKSFSLSKYVKLHYSHLYPKIHGVVEGGPFGLHLYSNLEYWKWVFSDVKSDNKEMGVRKRSLRKTLLITVIPLIVILICSVYLYLQFEVLS